MKKAGGRSIVEFWNYGAALSYLWMQLARGVRVGELRPKDIASVSPVAVRTVASPAYLDLFLACCQVAGVAVVLDGASCHLVGRKATIDQWLAFWPTRVDGWQKGQMREAFIKLRRGTRIHAPVHDRFVEDVDRDGDEADAAYRLAHSHWLGLLDIQHRIAEHWPALRIMRPSLPGEPEVILRQTSGGLLLGGCVWTPAYYLTGPAYETLEKWKKRCCIVLSGGLSMAIETKDEENACAA